MDSAQVQAIFCSQYPQVLRVFNASLRLVLLCVQVRLYLVVCVNRYTENKTCSGLSGPLDGYPLEAIPRGSGVDAVMTIGWLIVVAQTSSFFSGAQPHADPNSFNSPLESEPQRCGGDFL